MACGKSVIPYGFKTLVETLGKTVLFEQPADIHQFASVYFKELLEFRAVNPTLDLKELVNLFYSNKVTTAGPEQRSEWFSDPEEPANQNGTALSNMLTPIDQKACFLKKASLEDVSVLPENLIPSLLMTETSLNESNIVSKKEISEMVDKDEPNFVYIHTNICSVNQDESGFAYIYTNNSSVNQEDESTSIEHEIAHLGFTTGPLIKKASSANCKDTPQPANEFTCIPVSAQVLRAKVDNSIIRQASVQKSQPVSRKSESVPETPSAHRTLSSGTEMYQKTHKTVPVHAEAIPTHTEHFPTLCSDVSAFDNYKHLLSALGRVTHLIKTSSADKELGQKDSPVHMVDITPGDYKKQPEKYNSYECSSVFKTGKAKKGTLRSLLYTNKTDGSEKDAKKVESKKEPGVNEVVNEIQDMESISSPTQSEKVLSQHTSDSENEGSAPVTYHSYSHVPDSQLDLQLLHSETPQESLNIITEIFHKVYIRLGELEFQVQDLVNRFENLSTTVKEIHSAMNISPSNDSFCSDAFERYENYFHSSI